MATKNICVLICTWVIWPGQEPLHSWLPMQRPTLTICWYSVSSSTLFTMNLHQSEMSTRSRDPLHTNHSSPPLQLRVARSPGPDEGLHQLARGPRGLLWTRGNINCGTRDYMTRDTCTCSSLGCLWLCLYLWEWGWGWEFCCRRDHRGWLLFSTCSVRIMTRVTRGATWPPA